MMDLEYFTRISSTAFKVLSKVLDVKLRDSHAADLGVMFPLNAAITQNVT